MQARAVHINLVARDWRQLASFYIDVFGCEPLLPERDLSGDWLSEATGIAQAHIRGMHLLLPGYEERGPTLEIFEYTHSDDRPARRINQPGWAHLAFAVDDVDAAAAAVVRSGDSLLGKIVAAEIEGVGTLRFCYAADPEGNILELQRWA